MKILSRALLDFILPPTCLNCRAITSDAHRLCGPCWSKINFVSEPRCQVCSWPFDYTISLTPLCAACSQQPPLFTQARFVMGYDEASRNMIIRFKHTDATHLAPAFSDMMFQVSKEMLKESDYLIPIPLHRWRLLKRGYNQAALLTRLIARKSGKPALFNALQRTRVTPSQAGLKRQARQNNLRGAFSISLKHIPTIRDRIITVIDDVWTTGATLTQACQTLLRAGAKEVRVLTLARVLNATKEY